ncbi:MAG: hypothetical protein EXS49_01825 [Candidatus Pacebacteria bacterium]|nr:hypothetical protein [Candidatus Paceibacterota bacterium]
MKTTTSSIIIAIIIIASSVFIAGRNNNNSPSENINNVSEINGEQIITINAKGGYFPRTTIAKAEIATILKITTKGTFDCSSAINIPSLNYRANLPASGETIINISPQKTGTTITGLCAMGMYNFSVNFN